LSSFLFSLENTEKKRIAIAISISFPLSLFVSLGLFFYDSEIKTQNSKSKISLKFQPSSNLSSNPMIFLPQIKMGSIQNDDITS